MTRLLRRRSRRGFLWAMRMIEGEIGRRVIAERDVEKVTKLIEIHERFGKRAEMLRR